MQYIIGRHNVDDQGVPAGGITSGVGIHIEWQNGALRTMGSDEVAEPNGAFVEGVIEAAIDRVEHYQSTRFACAENEAILHFLRQALGACQERTVNRTRQGVEGTHETHDAVGVLGGVGSVAPDQQAIAEGVLSKTLGHDDAGHGDPGQVLDNG